MENIKRCFSIALACCLVIGMIPITAFAAKVDWEQAYSAFIKDATKDDVQLRDQAEYQLIYIDDDDIPELWIDYGFTYAGGQICTYDGKRVNSVQTWSYGDFSYIERGGFFYTSGGHMNLHYDEVYTLQNGIFEKRIRGDSDESTYGQFSYKWNGEAVTKVNYQRLLLESFDFSRAISINPSNSYNYADINLLLSRTTSISLDKYSMVLSVGEQDALHIMSDIGGSAVSFKSSDTSVVTVNSDGTVKAIGEGTATISVNEEGWGSVAHCSVIVTTTDGNRQTSFGGHSYQVFDESLTWQEAKDRCEALGGHLATITSSEERRVIESILKFGKKDFYWLGGTDSSIEGQWEWITHEPWVYQYWSEGNPNNFRTENYLGILRINQHWDGYSQASSTWNDYADRDAESSGFICEWDNQGSEPVIVDTISDETVMRAKLLTADYGFQFHRTEKSTIQIMANQLDPVPAAAWYTVENLIDMYFKAAKDGNMSAENVGEVTNIEFYEYLLFKLLDSEDMNYLSITEPFGLIDDLTDDAVDTALLKKLISSGFKSGTKITDGNKSQIKKICQSICGTDSIEDIGWMDAILVSGKAIDDFASEFVKLYALTTVSDARAEAIRMIGENAQVSALRTAAENVYSSIQRAKRDGVNYCVSNGLEESVDGLAAWLLNKMADTMCEIHPASKLWKATADSTTFIMDTIFLTDDISTDTIYILGMANIERALLEAIDQAEEAFLRSESVENAQRLIALADTLKRELLVGCDLVMAQVDHCERGNLNWHGILDLLKMASEKKFDFGATMKWIFGDKDSDYFKLRKSVTSIRQCIEDENFYSGSVSVLELLREVKTTIPSEWARGEVNKAINYDILPDWMQNNYQNNITRIEFCALLDYMITEKAGKTPAQLVEELAEKEGGYIYPPFSDALYAEVNDIARLGIVNGTGNNQFSPLGEITRQEAAIMLYRTADALGYDTTSNTADHSGVAEWAKKGVDFVTTKGIMNGTGNGFDPEGKYTKEQAIATLVRFFENVK